MPNITMALRETAQSVSRPIIFEAVAKVKEITGIGKDVPVYYPGDSGRMKQEGTYIESKERIPKLASNDFVFIEVEETTNQDWLGKTAVNRPDTPAIFLDKNLDTYLCTVYSMTDIVINVRYRTRSGTDARNWVDDARRRIVSLQQLFVQSFDYHYGIPTPLLELLNVIHHCRESFEGYGETFKEYLERHTDGRLTLISDLAGKSQIYAVAERQSRIIGSFNFEPLPEKPEYDQSTGTYTITFSYKFTYEKPISMNMKYPVIVHNQLLPPEYVIPVPVSDEDIGVRRMYSGSDIGLSNFEVGNIYPSRGDGIVRIPSHDEYQNRISVFGYSVMLSVLCTKDIEDRKKLFNLRDLGEYEVDSIVLDYILSKETNYITTRRDSIFYLALLNNEQPVADGSLILRNNGDVVSKSIIPLRDITRVCLMINTDTTVVKQDALDRLRRDKKVMNRILGLMNESVLSSYGRKPMTGKDYYTETDLRPEYRSHSLTERRQSPSAYGNGRINGIPVDITGKNLLALKYGLFRRKTVETIAITV